MLNNVTEGDFQPYRRTVLLSWILLSINALAQFNGLPVVFDEFYLLCFINAMCYTSIMHLVYYALNELKTILNI